MQLKHTQLKWYLTSDGYANFFGISTDKNWLMRIQQNGELSVQEQNANANLIINAPELLKICITIMEDDKLNSILKGQDRVELKNIIKKATEQ